MAVTTFISGIVSSLCIIALLGTGSFAIAIPPLMLPVLIIFTAIFNPAITVNKRKANIAARSLEVNAIIYIATPLAITLLWVSNSIDVARIDMLLVGSLIVILVNAIINIHTNNRVQDVAFRWLAIAIWFSGTFVLYRDEFFELLFEKDWLWVGKTDYFALLGLSSTLFALLLSFRRLRTIEISESEYQCASNLLWKIAMYSNLSIAQIRAKLSGFGNDQCSHDLAFIDNICSIDESLPGTDLSSEKEALEDYIENLPNICKPSEKSDLQREVLIFTHSKSTKYDQAETLILVMITTVSIAITLVTRPYFENWSGYIIDLFSIVFSSTLFLLLINYFSLKRLRRKSTFNFYQDRDSKFADITLPIILCIFSAIIYFILLYGKWFSSDWGWATELSPTYYWG